MIWMSLLLACGADRAELEGRNEALEEQVRLLEQRLALSEQQNDQLGEQLDEARSQLGAIVGIERALAREYEPSEARCEGSTLPGGLGPLANPESYGRDARMVPSPDGGYRLFGIRRGSLLDSCGFNNGDVLLRINELTLGPDIKAWTASAVDLALAPKLTVELRRKSVEQTLSFTAR